LAALSFTTSDAADDLGSPPGRCVETFFELLETLEKVG